MYIRSANEKDIKAIAAIYICNWRDSYRGLLPQEFLDGLNHDDEEAYWQQFIRNVGNSLFVCEDTNKTICAFIALEEERELEQCIYLSSLHVDKAYRGEGIGTALIRHAHALACEKDYRQMTVCVVRGNDRARTLYEKLGAMHYKYFEDNIKGAISQSEKLIWKTLM